MSRIPRLCLAVGLLALISACTTPQKDADGVEDLVIAASNHVTHTTGDDPAVSVSTTARLDMSGCREPGSFGRYSYLVFAMQGGQHAALRRATAEAYLAVTPFEDRLWITPSDVNIFMAPVTRPYASGDVTDFLDAYHYFCAEWLMGRIGAGDLGSRGGVFLVTYAEPIAQTPAIDRDRLLVQDITGLSPEFAELWVSEFKRLAIDEAFWDDGTFRQAMLRLRTQLPEIARAITITGRAIAGDLWSPEQ